MPRVEIVGSKIIPATIAFVVLTLCLARGTAAQSNNETGSRNVHLVSNVAIASGQLGNLVLDQSSDRPFLYATITGPTRGIVIFDLTSPGNPSQIYSTDWSESNLGGEPSDITYFQSGTNTYLVVGSSAEAEDDSPIVAASLFDVSGVGSNGRVSTVAQITAPGGFHALFAYRHSDGRNILFATGGGRLFVYDLAMVLSGSDEPLTSIEIPTEVANVDYGFQSMYAAYHPESEMDRLYTGAAGGYFVYDISDLENQDLLVSINSAAVQIGHTIIPTPDGTLAITTTGYPTAPIRIYDLQPALDGTIPRVRTALGAWVADWKNYTEHFAVRWPFVFVAAMQDGFQAFNMMFPVDPYTVGYYDTSDAPQSVGSSSNSEPIGAWDIDIRNTDGLIALSDIDSGLWLFRMHGFEGWDGRGWGFPNVSNAQDWVNGPVNSSEWDPIDDE